MNFQPVVPFGGYAGWQFLQRTLEAQKSRLSQDPALERATAGFEARFSTMTRAEDLVGDRQVLQVALGAYGLDEDLPNRAFIRKVLEEGTAEQGALANRLADSRYRALSEDLGFGPFGLPGYLRTGFVDDLLTTYRDRQFEQSVGAQNEDMRLALNMARELPLLGSKDQSADGAWFSVMGQPPLRAVFERAFGLPTGFGTLDLDQQLRVFREKADALLGVSEVSELSDAKVQDQLLRRFFANSTEIGGFSMSVRGAAALTLLQSAA